MKNLTAFIIGMITVMAMTVGTAEARHGDGLEGLLIGSAGGALVTHAMGGNAEDVIVGSVIGGTIGLLVDIGGHRDRVIVVDRPRHAPKVKYVYNDRWERRHERWHHRKHRRHDRNWRRHERRHYRW